MLNGGDGSAGGDLAQQRQIARVVGGHRRGLANRCAAFDHVGLEPGPAARRAGGRLFGQFGHFQRAGAVGEAADEAALLQRCDQPVDARLGGQVQSLLHLVERGRDARLLDPFVDEHQQFVLFAREHRQALKRPLRRIGTGREH